MFGERLKYLRQSYDLNQIQLAQKLGVQKQSVSNWENNNIMPSIEMLEKIADYFHISTDYLLGRDDKSIDGIHTIDVTGLTNVQIEHICQLIDDLRKCQDL